MSEKNETKIPYNLEAEQAILGCMIIDNEIISEIITGLTETDFYLKSHKYIYDAIKQTFNARKPVDFVTLADRLESDGNLHKAGDISYVVELTQITPSAANYKDYYDIVKRDGMSRNLIRAAGEISEFARTHDDVKKSLQFAENKIYGISCNNDTSTMQNIAEILPIVQEEYEKRAENKTAFSGLMTGINRLDRLTNGLQKSNLIVLAARPGVGKTSLAMNIVEHAAVNNDKVCAIFSLEMSKEELAKRILASVAEVSQTKSRAGEMDINDWRRMLVAMERLNNTKIEIDDSSIITPSEILSKCRRIKSRHGGQLDLIMIDYIQLMHSGDRAENRVQEVAAITRDLKIIAKELAVPVLALSQLRRPTEKTANAKQTLSDLRESGAIEQDADIVMFIDRPDMNASDEEINSNAVESGVAYLNVKKNRHGGCERIKLRFKGEFTKFVNPEPDEVMETRLTNA